MEKITLETIDMLILVAPVVVMLLAGIAVLLLLFRCWRSSLTFFFLALLLNWWTEQIPLHRGVPEVPPVKNEGTLRVLEYNICGKVDYVPQHGQPFIDYIYHVNADVIFLPENSVGTCFALEKMLQEEYPYSLHNFPEFEACKGMTFPDQTLYSRYPLTGYKRYRLDAEEMLQRHPNLDPERVRAEKEEIMAFEVTADVQGYPVTLVHVHLRTNGVDHAKDNAAGRRSLLENIYAGLQFGYSYRDAESRAIAKELKDCPNPLLVCGDFNDFSGSRCLSTIQNCRKNNTNPDYRDRLQDAWWKGGCGMGFTFDDQQLKLRLDHVLYSKEFELQGVSVAEVPYSDHLPLIADFKFRP